LYTRQPAESKHLNWVRPLEDVSYFCRLNTKVWIHPVSELKISTTHFNYPLPDNRIAKYPPAQRDGSKLLYLDKGQISERKFSEIPDLLPENALLIFNETRVIALFRQGSC